MEEHGTGSDADGQAPALRLAGLHKRFGETTAVDHLDLAVPRGSFFGLVGPNGAGKTIWWAETIRRRPAQPQA